MAKEDVRNVSGEGNGIIYSADSENFSIRKIAVSNGISFRDNDKETIKIFGTNATHQTKGVVQLASREELEQGIAPPNSVITVDSLKSHAVQKELSNQPYFWMVFRVEKKRSVFIDGHNIEGTDLRDVDGDFIIFKETSTRGFVPPVFCSGWSTCPYPTWIVNCVYSVSEGGLQASQRARGVEIKILPFFNYTRTFVYDYPVTIQVFSFGPW